MLLTKKTLLALLIIRTAFDKKKQPASLADYRWNLMEAQGDVHGRHENGFIALK